MNTWPDGVYRRVKRRWFYRFKTIMHGKYNQTVVVFFQKAPVYRYLPAATLLVTILPAINSYHLSIFFSVTPRFRKTGSIILMIPAVSMGLL
ncbi:hypothetical protein [Endozoicomonas sp. 8E]|uniref:hypothetical protein n=1 Tax=Endozoicomonas sp. 8E TaxID=3035692 RepID=UPI0029392E5D|nr:hypothetical protein [Endozoicomonas sp. 8E]WOG28538.1 hypothetical protein P6910_02460 [Endozoicomonas sp. 8E]